ncbi:hypothetical protein [Sphingobacterium sp. ML3W]|uniref:hypothetical protein n=1 Tax=Sphingobacterium sp. ML3W TaxID=1538644 RepID=UPI00130E5D86|nr:hypothetical protein [Sphingobacterium sp. ML3W]
MIKSNGLSIIKSYSNGRTLSVEYPITVAIDKDSYQIGNKEEFLYRRMAIQAARQRL